MFSVIVAMLCVAGPARAAAPTPQDADAFVERVNRELRRLWVEDSRAQWIKATYITADTDAAAAAAHSRTLAYWREAVDQARAYRDLPLKPETRKALEELLLAESAPSPAEPALREELTQIAARLSSLYGRGHWCPDGPKSCRDLQSLERTMAESRNPAELLDAWRGWREISPPMRADYARFVALSNQGAREIGFHDAGEMWRSRYDMKPEEFRAEADRLWDEMRPLYEQLHCYVRGRLEKQYGPDVVPPHGPIPAHLLGNMWAQTWDHLYPLAAPYPDRPTPDVTPALKAQGYDAERLVRLAESFYTSLGMDPLPDTFWKRSMLRKPADRDVVCHASAWDVSYDNDLRIKMCIEPDAETYRTVLHELGHVYYFHSYYRLPILFQTGAHDGFHEAIGDTMVLSLTPGYLARVGLGEQAAEDKRDRLNRLMLEALERVAFLPFGRLMDEWRWRVFSGQVTPGDYNKAWWRLRREYQGVAAPVERAPADFDPGAKYHIPANVPYIRYFLASVLTYQFHQALCTAAGQGDDPSQCSIAGSKAAGDKLRAMLSLGASRPWREALQVIGAGDRMDAGPLLAYYAPLRAWLEEQNRGQACGW